MKIYKLTNDTIDLISEKITALYKRLEVDKKDTLRARLMMEELLLKYKSRFGEDIELYFREYHIFSQTRFCLRIRAQSFDPFTLEENPMAFMIQSIMSGFNNGMPTWKYRNFENEIVFTVRRKSKIGSLAKIGIAILSSVIVGLICRAFVPADSLKGFVADYVDPLSNAYAGLFCVMAVLLTMFAITLSIVHIGDMASAGAFGGRIMRKFYLTTLCFCTVLTICVLPLFDISGLGSLNLAVKSIYDIVIGFIPTNIVSPFLNFNSIHIMIIGAMFGFALLTMGQQGETVVKLFDECNLVAVYTNNFLNKFITFYVALRVFNIVTVSDFSQVAGAGKMIGCIIAGEAVIMLTITAYTCIKTKTPIMKFVKGTMPAFMVCLSSANFGAAFNTVYDGLISVGVDGDTANIGINLGSVMYQPCYTLVVIFSSLFMAQQYGVEITVVWIIEAILLSIVLVSSVPNIPGAAISVFTLLFSQLGLPADALAIVIAINAILEFLTVAVDAWCLHGECLGLTFARKKAKEEA